VHDNKVPAVMTFMQPVRMDLLSTLFLMVLKIRQFSANDLRFHDHLLRALSFLLVDESLVLQ
jgi:hypothetical protein